MGTIRKWDTINVNDVINITEEGGHPEYRFQILLFFELR